jgi:hypothetical protein
MPRYSLNTAIIVEKIDTATQDLQSEQKFDITHGHLIQKSYEGQKKKLYTEFSVKAQEMRLTNGSA